MLIDYFITTFKEKFVHKPTGEQEELIRELSRFVLNTEDDTIFLLKGYAGTGKTTITSALVNAMREKKQKSALLAPTGRAAKVFSSYSKQNAYTIHKKIYRLKTSYEGFGKFVLDKNLHTNTIFFVDEASMISNSSFENSSFGSGRLLEDLLEYVYEGENCKIIFIGDTAQLPPVKLNISPALDAKELVSLGYNVETFQLTDVIRQAKESGILTNATLIRNLIKNFTKNGFPVFENEYFPDIIRVNGSELIESISDSYDKHGNDQTLIVTRSNKRANRYNQGIRSNILWREEEISAGDFLMIVKNNYFWAEDIPEIDFIANGDVAEIQKISNHEEMYGYRFVDVTLSFPDYNDIEIDVKIMLDTLDINTASMGSEENKKFYMKVAEDYQKMSKRKTYQKIRENEYFNALQVKFAYAVTCHKSQGGQWETVYIDQGYVTEDRADIEYLRWLYTAITRASKKLYLVNFKDSFFK